MTKQGALGRIVENGSIFGKQGWRRPQASRERRVGCPGKTGVLHTPGCGCSRGASRASLRNRSLGTPKAKGFRFQKANSPIRMVGWSANSRISLHLDDPRRSEEVAAAASRIDLIPKAGRHPARWMLEATAEGRAASGRGSLLRRPPEARVAVASLTQPTDRF